MGRLTTTTLATRLSLCTTHKDLHFLINQQVMRHEVADNRKLRKR